MPEPSGERPPRAPARGAWLELACRMLSYALPFAVLLPHLNGEARFDTDLRLLRGLSWTGNSLTGAASAWVVQASYWLPLGTPAYRAALASLLCLTCASGAVFSLTRSLLAANTSRVAPALALIAALTVSLCAAAQREAELAGGASLALALSLLALQSLTRGPALHPQRAAVLGLLLGALLAERWVCLAVVALGASFAWRMSRLRPSPRVLACSALAAVAALVLLWSPLALRPWALYPFMDVGRFSAGEIVRDSASGVSMLHRDFGFVASVLALAGGAVSAWRPGLRRAAYCLGAIVALDALSAWLSRPLLGDLAALHLLALAALAVAIAVAIESAIVALSRVKLPMTRGAAVFLVMADLTLAAAAAEEAAFARDDEVARGTEAMTREAISRLPEGTALLVRSPALITRVLAARLVDQERPDLLLLGSSLSAEPRYAAALLRREPAMQQLLRDAALEGYPREEALTIVADARPLLCELDRAWDRRTVSHLVADGLWLRYAPQPLGASDRRSAYPDLVQRAEAVASASLHERRADATTAALLRGRVVDAVRLAAALGDRDELPLLVAAIERLVPDDAFARELRARLSAGKDRIDWKALPE